MAYSMEKDTYTCDYCGVEMKWDDVDEQRGAIWGCEVCESKHFCTACFKERYGAQRFLDMTQNDPMIMCPDCYGIIRYNPRRKGGQ